MNYLTKIRQLLFFHNFFCHVAFCEAGPEGKVTFLNLLPTPEIIPETKSLPFLLQFISHRPGRLGEDWLHDLGLTGAKITIFD